MSKNRDRATSGNAVQQPPQTQLQSKAPTTEPPVGSDVPIVTPSAEPAVQAESPKSVNITDLFSDKITHSKETFSDYDAQDRKIAYMEDLGYEHYESLPLGGNEILLRFRKKR